MQKLKIFFLGILFALPFGAEAMTTESVLNLINIERGRAGLGALQMNAKLNQAAEIKASDMVAKNYFDHNSPDGTTPWDLYDRVGYSWASAAENLAVNSGSWSESSIVEGWMNSPGHRTNILEPKHTETGIGIAEGTYKGQRAVYVTQLFGSPKAVSEPIVIPVVPIPTPVPTPVPDPQPVVTIQTPTQTVVKKVVEKIAPKAEAHETEEPHEEVATTTTSVVSTSTATTTSRVVYEAESRKISWLTRVKVFFSRIFTFRS